MAYLLKSVLPVTPAVFKAPLSKLNLNVYYVPMIYFVHVLSFVAATNGQEVTVTLQSEDSYEGNHTTLSCSYTILNNTYMVYQLEWFKGESVSDPSTSLKIAEFFQAATSPIYSNGYDEPSRYNVSRDIDNSISTFDILNVEFRRDRGRYLCRVTVVQPDGTNINDEVASTDLIVYILPTSIHLSDSTGDYPSDNSVISYVVEGEGRQYTCQVPDINPGATFSWNVGSQPLTPDGSENVTGADGLINSSSMATLTATWSNHGEMMKCQASNKDGNLGISISVTLDVKVPPKSSAMSLLDGSVPLQDPADIIEKTDYTFTCRVQATRPAATIRWFLDDVHVEQTTTTTSPGGGNGLVDTYSYWTFTTERVNHKQMVKCEANTTESKTPFPSVSTTLNVIGPPDTPVISGSMTMTENVATTLTCTADLGYPEDWTLEWSNEGTVIVNPSDTTAALSGTSQRYMFTSQLVFTPNRQDNTHFIQCAAKKNSWTSTPLPEQTWGPINVQYETNITNKDKTYVGIRSGLTANLSCIAKGNPAPVITWFDPNITKIVDGGGDNKYMVAVSYTTSDSDMTVGSVTISELTIQAVNPEVDYGVYTCNSTNDIGHPDSHVIIIDGTRRPNTPTGVVRTDRTSSSIAVRWTKGDDGGEPQWFHVSHNTSDPSESFSKKIEGGMTTYNVTGLESYTQYEIRVYAENDVDRNPNPGSIVEFTLPELPTDFTIEFNKDEGTVKISGLTGKGGCIQLEVKYEGSSSDWKECANCIKTNGSVNLADVCPQTRKRRRRAAGDVVYMYVRASYCQGAGEDKLCTEHTNVGPKETPVNGGSDSTGIIVGGVVGGCVLLVIIGGLIVYLKRTSPNKPTGTEISSSIELATDNFGQNGQVNEGLRGSVDDEPETPTTTWSVDQATKTGGAETNAKPIERLTTDSGDTYAIVKKEKRPHPKAPPQNLPDVTYAEVNKKTPVAGLAKKPKKYVPPSKVTEESDYDDVKVPQQNKKSKSGAGSSGYEEVNLDSPKTPANYDDGEGDYANLTEPQSDSGRTVNEDGLIYMEVGHLKSHPVNQPPIQTEESTTYASIDFLKKTPDVARN